MPEFEIECAWAIDLLCHVVGQNFDAEWAIQDAYSLQWLITPSVSGAEDLGSVFVIDESSLVIDRDYIIVATVTLSEYPEISTSLNYSLKVWETKEPSN